MQNHIFGTVDGLEGFDQTVHGPRSTWMVTSSGIIFRSIRAQNFRIYSVSSGGGKPTSISLAFVIHQRLEIFSFLRIHGVDQGLVAIAQSTLHQSGAWSIPPNPAKVRSGMYSGWNRCIFAAFVHHDKKTPFGGMKKRPRLFQSGRVLTRYHPGFSLRLPGGRPSSDLNKAHTRWALTVQPLRVCFRTAAPG